MYRAPHGELFVDFPCKTRNIVVDAKAFMGQNTFHL